MTLSISRATQPTPKTSAELPRELHTETRIVVISSQLNQASTSLKAMAHHVHVTAGIVLGHQSTDVYFQVPFQSIW